MKPTDQSLLEQLRITDREIERRKDLFNFTKEDIDILADVKPYIANDLDLIVDDFYEEQVANNEVAHVIGDSESLAKLKGHMCAYIMSLFEGPYDSEYIQSRLRIGLVHKRIGVPPKLYVAAFQKLLNILRDRIMQASRSDCARCDRAISALEKIMLFDLVLVFDTFIFGLMDELARRNDEIEEYAASLEEEVKKRTKQLSDMARKDDLTGLLNQQSFYEHLRREVSRSHRRNHNLALAYMDLDGFKKANDTLGHQKGDKILVATANVITESLRETDIAARYGGDEFCIIFPEATGEEAGVVLARIIKKFEDRLGPDDVHLSVGLALLEPGSGMTADAMVKAADSGMYEAKQRSGSVIETASK